MTASPKYIPGQANADPISSRLAALEKAVANLTNKTLYSAFIGNGGLTVSNGIGGLGQFYVGNRSSAPAHADTTPQYITSIGDEAGRDRLTLWDDTTPANPNHQRWYEWDINGLLVRSQDINGGWATPWLSVHMYPRFVPNGQPPAYSANGWGFGYANVSTTGNNISSGMVMWEGRIPFVSHPRIQVDGVWGNASGSPNPTFNLVVGGTTVGSFTPAGLVTGTWGPFDISSLLTHTAIQVQITATWGGAGSVAADCLGVYLRQT